MIKYRDRFFERLEAGTLKQLDVKGTDEPWDVREYFFSFKWSGSGMTWRGRGGRWATDSFKRRYDKVHEAMRE